VASRTTRPEVPLEHGDEEEHRRIIAQRANIGLPKDGSQSATQPVRLKDFVVANLPDAALWEGGIVYVSDETGGAVLAFADGTNWRRVTDRAVVS
jgi:hypothetical protein